MTPRVGWAVAVAVLTGAWVAGRWQGLALAFSGLVFVLLMQFNRSVRVMQQAAGSPVGRVPSAVMLHAALRQGMPMLQIVKRTGSLGRQVGESPETWAWTDDAGNEVRVELDQGRCTRWELRRPPDAVA